MQFEVAQLMQEDEQQLESCERLIIVQAAICSVDFGFAPTQGCGSDGLEFKVMPSLRLNIRDDKAKQTGNLQTEARTYETCMGPGTAERAHYSASFSASERQKYCASAVIPE